MRPFVTAGLGCLVAACAAQRAPLVPGPDPTEDPLGLAVFVRDHDIDDVELSPSGKWLAAHSHRGGVSEITLIDVESLGVRGGFRLPEGQLVLDLHWASDDGLVFAVGLRDGILDTPRYIGDILFVPVDSLQPKVVFGPRVDEGPKWSRIRRGGDATRAWGTILDPLVDDPDHILVSAVPWTKDTSFATPTVYQVSIRSGARKTVVRGPKGGAAFITDEVGAVRAAVAMGEAGRLVPFALSGGEWVEVEAPLWSADARPIAATSASNSLFVLDEDERGDPGLYALDLGTGERELLSAHPRVEPTSVVLGHGTGKPVAVSYEPDYPEWVVLDPDDPTARILEELSRQYPSARLSLRSRSRDGRRAVVLVAHDVDPGVFFLADVDTKEAKPLLRRHESIDSASMRPMEASPSGAGTASRSTATSPCPPMIRPALPRWSSCPTADRMGFVIAGASTPRSSFSLPAASPSCR